MSFVWMWFADTSIKPSLEVTNASPGSYKCETVMAAAYKTLVTDVEAAEKAEADKKAKEAEENKNKDDWATQTTAHATALLAAVYALVF